MPFAVYMETPAGPLTLGEENGALTFCRFGPILPEGYTLGETALLREGVRELSEYFSGGRRRFSLPLSPQGTPFQKAVWKALEDIPYGETATYGEIAEKLGNPRACRAVGLACGRNPLLVLVPCHRVVGKDGALTGYAGGMEVKRQLLALESGWKDKK